MDLVIDGNAFLNVAISVTKSAGAKDLRVGEAYWVSDLFNEGKFMLKEHSRTSFRNFCFTYLNSLIVPIGSSLRSVHFVFDSKSWRKEYISSFFKSSEFKTTSAPTEFTYKGNRKYDDHQYLFFDYFQQVIMPAMTNQCGINSYRFRGTEGDDIIAYLCNLIKEDILIYSVDQDLKQLVENPDKNVLLIVPKQMSKTKKLFVPMTLVPEKAETEEDDFFSLSEAHIGSSTVSKVITNLKSKDYAEFRVNATEEILTKVLLGDKSDHIPRLTSLTPLKGKKIIANTINKYPESVLKLIDTLDPEFIGFLISEIAEANKIKDADKIDEIRTHLIFNIRIIRLSISVFPDEIREALDQFFKEYSITKFNSKEFSNLKNNLSSI